MRILLMIRDTHIEFIKGFIKLLNNNIGIYIKGEINDYIKEYINNNMLNIVITNDLIKKYDIAITFTYDFNELLDKINYKGKIISHAHGISLKPYFPNKVAKKNQLFLCAFTEFQRKFFKEKGIKRVELFPYLKLLTIDKVDELEEFNSKINLNDSILWAPTLINKFSNSSVNKIDKKIFELSKFKKVFILLHPQTEIKDINYYLKNENIYLINRSYYSNNFFDIENCINIKKLSTSIDILNYFKYIICDQSTIFYEGLFLNKIVYRTDLIKFNEINLNELDKYNTTLCPYSLNKMDNKYNKEGINMEEIIKELIKRTLFTKEKSNIKQIKNKPNKNILKEKTIIINFNKFRR